MRLIRWQPFSAMEDGFNRFMQCFSGRWPQLGFDEDQGTFYWRSRAGIHETEKEYRIRVEWPPMKKEDVKVTVSGGVITLSGEHRQKEQCEGRKLHRDERFCGHFERSFWLPHSVDSAAIRCDNHDGVLMVHLPKARVE